MRVLVTGSSGKLGSVTVKLLADFGYMVTGLDISSSATTNLIANVKDRYKMLEVAQGFDAVIHTANSINLRYLIFQAVHHFKKKI